jgi:hypothetical protein
MSQCLDEQRQSIFDEGKHICACIGKALKAMGTLD